MTKDELYPAGRLGQVREAVGAAGLDAVLLTPGPDLRYVIGYDAKQLERLTCLAIPAEGEPALFVPRLELAAAQASPAGSLGLEMIPWEETDDPFALVADLLGPVATVGLSDRMWALSVLKFRDALPGARLALAGRALRTLRISKTPAEVAALREAGAAIDRVHARVPGWLRPGLTERAVGSVITEAILAEGHATVDFVIVGSGPNAASPHHEVSDRVLAAGDVVVVDIGGTMPSGYCSDSTRTYALGEPPPEFSAYYEVLYDAQEAACAAVRPGVTAESVDAAAREPITGPATGRRSSTAPGTVSAWRRTRTRTSWRATPSRSSRAWRSRWNQGSTPGRTARGSRTSWSAPPTVPSDSTTPRGSWSSWPSRR